MSAEAIVLFSGGTDSTLAAAQTAEKYSTVHLLTFFHAGIHQPENSARAVERLRDKFGQNRFIHEIVNVDRLFRYVWYDRYWHYTLNHGHFMLAVCGFCKLAMHARTIIYSKKNGITNVYDGANRSMDIYPDQMPGVLFLLRDLYEKFGLCYQNPVFDTPSRPVRDFLGEGYSQVLQSAYLQPGSDRSVGEGHAGTTEDELFRLGLIPAVPHKGTPLDRQLQGRCFQLTLLRMFADKWYLQSHDKAEYDDKIDRLFSEKIADINGLIARYLEKGEGKIFFE